MFTRTHDFASLDCLVVRRNARVSMARDATRGFFPKGKGHVWEACPSFWGTFAWHEIVGTIFGTEPRLFTHRMTFNPSSDFAQGRAGEL